MLARFLGLPFAVTLLGACLAVDTRDLVGMDGSRADVSQGTPAIDNDAAARSDTKPDVSRGVDASAGSLDASAASASTRDATTIDDASSSEAAARDGATSHDATDGPTDAAIAPEASWGDFLDPTNWQSVAIGIGTALPGAGAFQGGAFDGRYVYFAPTFNGGTLTRYDTTGSFTVTTSWAHLDLTTIDTGSDARATSFAGAAFDGRYLYLAPFENQPSPGGVVLQCDTTVPGGCISPQAWSTFGVSSLVGVPAGFLGAVYDGRYVTFVPFVEPQSGGPNSTLARFDTQAPGGFRSAASWSTMTISAAVPGGTGFYGGVFDGRRIYFISPPAIPSIVAIYDTTRPLNDFAAWSGVDVTSDAGVGQYGGGFDGRYVYLSPAPPLPTLPISAARCDTQSDAGCSSPSSWARFDLAAVNGPDAGTGQYVSTAFDGRYMYFPPYSSTNVALRFDTTRAFNDRASWSRFELSGLEPGAMLGFNGAVFDGEYVYFVPGTSTYVVRFHAREPRSAPGRPSYGSFL